MCFFLLISECIHFASGGPEGATREAWGRVHGFAEEGRVYTRTRTRTHGTHTHTSTKKDAHMSHARWSCLHTISFSSLAVYLSWFFYCCFFSAHTSQRWNHTSWVNSARSQWWRRWRIASVKSQVRAAASRASPLVNRRCSSPALMLAQTTGTRAWRANSLILSFIMHLYCSMIIQLKTPYYHIMGALRWQPCEKLYVRRTFLDPLFTVGGYRKISPSPQPHGSWF